MKLSEEILEALAAIRDPYGAAEFLAPKIVARKSAQPAARVAAGLVVGKGRGRPVYQPAIQASGRGQAVAPAPPRQPQAQAQAQLRPQGKPRQSVPAGQSLERLTAQTSDFYGPTLGMSDGELMGQLGLAGVRWFGKVKRTGNWNFKKDNHPEYQDHGNIAYGATGRALGLPNTVLRRGAGFVQEYGPNYDPSFGHWYGAYPYGDDPADQVLIDRGILWQDRQLRR